MLTNEPYSKVLPKSFFFKYNEYIFYSNINQLMSKEQSLNKLMKWYKIDNIS